MTLVNFVRTNTQPMPGGANVWFFKPGNAQFYGNVGLIVATDADACVRSISLTVRRSFVEDPKTARFGRDVMKSFLTNGLSATSARLVSALITRLAQFSGMDEKQDAAKGKSTVDAPSTAALKVFVGEQPSVEQTLEPDRLRIENIMASNGAPLLRVAIW